MKKILMYDWEDLGDLFDWGLCDGQTPLYFMVIPNDRNTAYVCEQPFTVEEAKEAFRANCREWGDEEQIKYTEKLWSENPPFQPYHKKNKLPLA